MFDEVTLTGAEATIVWGYRTAAVCAAWTVTKTGRAGGWLLSAVVTRADPFQLRQQVPPLKFTAPRKGGFFCWPVLTVTLDGARLAATLGPPES